MTRIEKLNNIQKCVVDALEGADFNGSYVLSVRAGKTLCLFKILYRMLELEKIKKGDTIRFWSKYVQATKTMLLDEEKAAIEILGKNPFEDFNFISKSTQSGIEGTEDIAVVEAYDELDTIFSAQQYLCIKNSNAPYKIGFTGTIDSTASVFLGDLEDTEKGMVRQTKEEMKKGLITKNINKGQLLELLLPVVFTYTPQQAIADGIIASFETTVLEHTLGTKEEYLTPRGWNKTFNERDYYANRESARRDYKKPMYLRSMAGKDQVDLMYTMKSKVHVCRQLLKLLQGKTIIFGIRKEPLYQITPNVCESKTTKQLIDDFRENRINTIASAKMISRVITLPRVDNVIIFSFYTKSSELIQSIARSLLSKDTPTNVYIFRTIGTREEEWFEKVQLIFDTQGKIVERLNLNIKQHLSTKNLFIKDFQL